MSDLEGPIHVLFDKDEALFYRWKVKSRSRVIKGSDLMLYKVGEVIERFKCPDFGVIFRVEDYKEGDVITKGDPIISMHACEHSVVMKEMCADCGKDLRRGDRSSGDRQETSDAQVAVLHSIPELVITHQEAQEYGKDEDKRLLMQRKLHLLVDLDQTLIHTTTDTVAMTNVHKLPPGQGKHREILVDEDVQDLYHFYMGSVCYHTKLRPHTTQFLQNISKKYQLHICTFGVRLYAHTIAKMLDPDGSLFRQRILSRDECFDSSTKTSNLKALFPHGIKMVCIIDDREDVWHFASNVIPVKPYKFFRHTGDINAPPGFQKDDDENGKSDATATPDPSDATTSGETTNKPSKSTVTKSAAETTSANGLHTDRDRYLHHLEEILLRIHTAYYQIYDQSPAKPPDMKAVVPYVKKKVLCKVSLVFSAVIPTNQNAKNTPIYQLAQIFGARIQERVITHHRQDDHGNTTHLVLGKYGTSKMHEARRHSHVRIVSPRWLWTCFEQWARVDERPFLIQDRKSAENLLDPIPNDTDPNRPYKEGRRSSARAKVKAAGTSEEFGCLPFSSYTSPDVAGTSAEASVATESSNDPNPSNVGMNLPFSTYAALHEMEQEVDAELDDDDDDDDDDAVTILPNDVAVAENADAFQPGCSSNVMVGSWSPEVDSADEHSSSQDSDVEVPQTWRKRKHRNTNESDSENSDSQPAKVARDESFEFTDVIDLCDESSENDETNSLSSIDDDIAEAVEREFRR